MLLTTLFSIPLFGVIYEVYKMYLQDEIDLEVYQRTMAVLSFLWIFIFTFDYILFYGY